jgi:hypothetical protein
MMFAQRDPAKQGNLPQATIVDFAIPARIRPSTSNKRPFGIHHPSWSCWSAVRPRSVHTLAPNNAAFAALPDEIVDTINQR